MKFLMILDGEYVQPEDKVKTRFKFNFQPEVKANTMNTSVMLLRQLNYPLIGLPVFPYDSPPPPMLILVGPPGSRKKELVKRICQEMPR